jgi:hypothetical protein
VRHVRMLGLCLAAAMALTAFAASSAFAGAEFGKCEAKAGGNYKDANCTEKAKPKGSGSYEWKKGSELSPVKFTGANEGSGGVLYSTWDFCEYKNVINGYEELSGEGRVTRAKCEEEKEAYNYPYKVKGHREKALSVSVECTSENSSGETVGKTEVSHVNVTFKGCNALGSIPCENAGPEEIKTEELKGKLGYISKSGHEAGILLEPAKKHGTFATFSCPEIGLGVVVGAGNKKEGAEWTSSGCIGACPGTTPEEEKHGGYDGIISPIKPVNQMTSKYTQEYKIERDEGYPVNIPRAFEKKHIDVLESYTFNEEEGTSSMWAASGQEITNVNTLQPAGEEGEIKA